jgi:Domain of unknown function (DUF4251)
MKSLIKLFLVFAVVLGGLNAAHGQSTRAERQAAKAAKVKKMVDDVNFVFKANYANPQGGGSRALTSDYDLKVVKDSVIAYLPYFGRAYVAPAPGTTEGGIKFTSTNFKYDAKQGKKGGWEIVIKPKDHDITNWRDVQQLILNISTGGYASLQVLSSNRSPISFDGELEDRGSKN